MDFNKTFWFFKNNTDSTKQSIYNIVFTLLLVSIISLGNHIYLLHKFAYQFKSLSSRVYQKYHTFKTDNNEILIYHYAINSEIYVIDKDKLYVLHKNDFSIMNNKLKKSILSFNITYGIDIEYPNFVVYKYDDIFIKIKLTPPNGISFHIFVIMFIMSFIINMMYAYSLRKNTLKMKNLKVFVQEYALSQRTTSYLIRIIHHKLNSPLNIISAKSKMLHNAINKQQDIIAAKIVNRCNEDYMRIEDAMDTIFAVTNKLKHYNELSQNESNIYNLLTIAKETIDILTDNTFEIDIAHQIKLFEIDKTIISSHEIIQIFINQIKFSLTQLADTIAIKVFKFDNNSITLWYSDNGNMIDKDLDEILKTNSNISEFSGKNIVNDHYDLLLNFNILNRTIHSNIKNISSNKTGIIFQIKLPTFKQNI